MANILSRSNSHDVHSDLNSSLVDLTHTATSPSVAPPLTLPSSEDIILSGAGEDPASSSQWGCRKRTSSQSLTSGADAKRPRQSLTRPSLPGPSDCLQAAREDSKFITVSLVACSHMALHCSPQCAARISAVCGGGFADGRFIGRSQGAAGGGADCPRLRFRPNQRLRKGAGILQPSSTVLPHS